MITKLYLHPTQMRASTHRSGDAWLDFTEPGENTHVFVFLSCLPQERAEQLVALVRSWEDKK